MGGRHSIRTSAWRRALKERQGVLVISNCSALVRRIWKLLLVMLVGAAGSSLVSIGIARHYMIDWRAEIYHVHNMPAQLGLYETKNNAVWDIESLHNSAVWVVAAEYRPSDNRESNELSRPVWKWWQLNNPQHTVEFGEEARIPHWSMILAVENDEGMASRVRQAHYSYGGVDCIEFAAGWPFLSLRSGTLGAIPPPFVTWELPDRSLANDWGEPRMDVITATQGCWMPFDECSFWNEPDACRLPLVPVFPGFIINAALYGIAMYSSWWLVATLCSIVRTTHRRRHGRCVGCGYSLARNESGRCPECGRAF